MEPAEDRPDDIDAMSKNTLEDGIPQWSRPGGPGRMTEVPA
jgi:hypothetical protein